MMIGPLAKAGYYGFTNVTGDIVLALPSDASFHLTAKISEKHNIVSDFKLTYLNDAPSPPPAATPRSPEATPKPPAPKAGPVIAPVTVAKPMHIPYVLRRINAVCGTGDATISIASFGGNIRIKKI